MLPHEEKHTKILRQGAAECAILLKKDGHFPLGKPCKLALFGSGARNTVKGGTGSGNVYCRSYSTAEDGLKSAGFEITTKPWMDAYEADRARHHADFIASIKKDAADRGVSPFVAGFGKIEPEYDYDLPIDYEGDACVYVLARTSGEGNDRQVRPGDVLLTDTEVRDILALNQRFERFMLVLNVGGVVDLTPVKEVKNILYLSQLGTVTGDILADILLGKTYPSGKLTTTWAGVDAYQTIGEFGGKDDTRYKESVYVGYRYFDTAGTEPFFPFGFGLGYTEFTLDVVKCTANSVTAKVTNTGKRPGKEVAQLYVSPAKGKIAKPYQSLLAFVKTRELNPGESEEVTLPFDIRDAASYCEACAAFVLEKGDYILRVGNSSRSTVVAAVLRLDADIQTKKLKNLLGKPDFEDAALDVTYSDDLRDVPVIELPASAIGTETCSYEIDHTVDPFVDSLPDEDLAHLCLGAFLEGTTGFVIGNSALHIAGAAGETTNHLDEKLGGQCLVMADGPAGLRLSPKWYQNEDGAAVSAIDKLPDGLDEIVSPELNAMVQAAYDSVPKDKLQEHFTTAIPIGTALAQSWNPNFCEDCGDIVGAEMELYGVQLWLAPALNIHRNILCGRNFEYFSEDPMISGKMAAAITRGVQRHPNCGTTIKHFAANNQENNRYNSNSIVSERAMREIYLRGFEIAIREAQPQALMTSYNLLNGEHTSQRKDLIEDILRGEFGFKGLVMTDWITTGQMYDPSSAHPTIYAHKVIGAGNDIVMPGGQPDFEDLMAALKSGALTRRELAVCAARVLRQIKKNAPAI